VTPQPTFDSQKFGAWLRRWRQAEGLEWSEIAERSGLNRGTLQTLARGTPNKAARERGQIDLNPGVVTLARLADGLGLELGYVLSKGGLTVGSDDRWDHFSKAERALIRQHLSTTLVDTDDDEQQHRENLVHQLDSTLDQEVPA
jgi:transcriptional regulator with XRE-family HTH domain